MKALVSILLCKSILMQLAGLLRNMNNVILKHFLMRSQFSQFQDFLDFTIVTIWAELEVLKHHFLLSHLLTSEKVA